MIASAYKGLLVVQVVIPFSRSQIPTLAKIIKKGELMKFSRNPFQQVTNSNDKIVIVLRTNKSFKKS